MSNPKPCATYIVVVVLYIYFINKLTITTMTTNVYSRETAVHNGKATTKTARPQALQERPSTWLHTWPTKVWRSIEPGRTHPDCPRLVAWTETELLDGGNETDCRRTLVEGARSLSHNNCNERRGAPRQPRSITAYCKAHSDKSELGLWGGGATPPALLPRTHQVPVSIKPCGKPSVGQRQLDLPLALTSFTGSPPQPDHVAGPRQSGSLGHRAP